MREIKFRAWDKKLNKYHYFSGIFNLQPSTERSTFPQYESMPEYHELIVEQYTGLKDENGVEIYEGEFLRTEEGEIYLVLWHKEYASFCLSKKGFIFVHYFNEAIKPEEVEVIGNIHENPELLEVK